jgi:hypothetical protein
MERGREEASRGPQEARGNGLEIFSPKVEKSGLPKAIGTREQRQRNCLQGQPAAVVVPRPPAAAAAHFVAWPLSHLGVSNPPLRVHSSDEQGAPWAQNRRRSPARSSMHHSRRRYSRQQPCARSPVEVATAALHAIDTLNPKLNAVISLDRQDALSDAEGIGGALAPKQADRARRRRTDCDQGRTADARLCDPTHIDSARGPCSGPRHGRSVGCATARTRCGAPRQDDYVRRWHDEPRR